MEASSEAKRANAQTETAIAAECLSVIVPVYNEIKNIETIAARIAARHEVKEIIFVDDGSTDGTAEVITSRILPAHPRARLLRHPENRGKGAAIRTAIAAVTGPITIIQDADLEYSPRDYPRLLEPILNGAARVVYGSRFNRVNKFLFVWHWFLNRFFGKHYEIRYLHHFIGIQLLNVTTNILYRAGTTDEATCYKAFRTEILKAIPLKCTGFEFCPEVTAKVRKRGISIVEVPIQYHPRSTAEGKKLKWTHGFEAVWTLIKYRFVD